MEGSGDGYSSRAKGHGDGDEQQVCRGIATHADMMPASLVALADDTLRESAETAGWYTW